jgi:hypothetical protein
MDKLFAIACPIEEKMEIVNSIFQGKSLDDKMELNTFFPKKNYFLLRWVSKEIDYYTKSIQETKK